MKKPTITLTLILIFIGFYLNAQVSLGLRTSYVQAHQDYGDVEVPEDAKIHIHGIQVSLLSRFDLNKFLSLHLEPGFIRRGAACEPAFLVFNSDTRFLLDYVELPFFISARLPACNKSCELYFKTGYSISRLHSAHRERLQIGTDEPVTSSPVTIGGRWGAARSDHGFHLGIGFAYIVGKGQIVLDMSYYKGFVDVIPFTTSKNISAQLGLGYMHNF